MPEEGYKSITVTDETYTKLQTLAEKNSRSISRQIEYFLKTCKEA
jgi:predicted CopG family antitoxin